MTTSELLSLLTTPNGAVTVTGTVEGRPTVVIGYVQGIRREDGSGRSFLVDLIAGNEPTTADVCTSCCQGGRPSS